MRGELWDVHGWLSKRMWRADIVGVATSARCEKNAVPTADGDKSYLLCCIAKNAAQYGTEMSTRPATSRSCSSG